MPKTLNEIRTTTADLKNITYTQRIEDLCLALQSYQDSLAVTEALTKNISQESAKTKGTVQPKKTGGDYICLLTGPEEVILFYTSSCYAIVIRDNDYYVSGYLDYFARGSKL